MLSVSLIFAKYRSQSFQINESKSKNHLTVVQILMWILNSLLWVVQLFKGQTIAPFLRKYGSCNQNCVFRVSRIGHTFLERNLSCFSEKVYFIYSSIYSQTKDIRLIKLEPRNSNCKQCRHVRLLRFLCPLLSYVVFKT